MVKYRGKKIGGYISRGGPAPVEGDPSGRAYSEEEAGGADARDVDGAEPATGTDTPDTDATVAEDPPAPAEQPQAQAQPPAENPRVGLDAFERRRDQNYDALHQARRTIKNIEQDAGRQLTPEEKQLIINRHLNPESLSAIDQKSNELLAGYDRKLNEGWFKRTWRKFGNKIATIAGTTAASMGLRWAITSLFPSVAPVAGTITGAVIGGIAGGIRGYLGERNKQFGYNAIISEYNTLKSDETNPNRVADSLAFLHKMLETKSFRGSAGDVLKMLVFYKKEVGANVNEQAVESVLNTLSSPDGENYQMFDEYRRGARSAMLKSMGMGALKGAYIGAGIGFVSDTIGWLTHHLRFEDAKQTYLDQHWGDSNEFHPPVQGVDPTLRPDPAFAGFNEGYGLGLAPTDYGHTLSNAIRGGIETGQLNVPTAYLDAMAKEGLNAAQATERFIYNFNFVQPPHLNDTFAAGAPLSLNIDGVSELMHKMIEGGRFDEATNTWVGGMLNYDAFADNVLRDGGNFIHNQFPSAMNKQILLGTDNILMNRALEAAASDSLQTTAQTLVQGGLAGAATGYQIDKMADKMTGEAKGGKEESEDGATGGANDERPRRQRQEQRQETAQQEGEQAQEGEETAGENPTNQEETTPEINLEEAPNRIPWEAHYQGDKPKFLRLANGLLAELSDKPWGDLTETQREDIANLFKFASKANRSPRFKLNILIDGEERKIQNTNTFDSENPVFKVMGERGAEPATITLTGNQSLRIIENELRETGYQNLRPADFRDDENNLNLERLETELGRAKQNAETEIVVNRILPGEEVFAGDNGRVMLGFLGMDRDRGRIAVEIVETGQRTFIDRDNLDKIELHITKWENPARRGGGRDHRRR